MVVAVVGDVENFAGAGDRRLEASGLRDDEICGDAAVGPSANTEFIGIGDALREGVVHHGHIVLVVLVSPIGKNGFAEFLAVAGRAARIGQKYGIAIRSVELREVVERSGILADRAAMRVEQRGNFFAGSVVDRLVEKTGDRGAGLAFEMNVVDLGETELREGDVVGLGEASEIVSIRKIDFVGAIEHADLRGDRSVFTEGIGGYGEAAADGAGDLTASDRNAAEILRSVIFGNEIDEAALLGTTLAADAPVKP